MRIAELVPEVFPPTRFGIGAFQVAGSADAGADLPVRGPISGHSGRDLFEQLQMGSPRIM